MTASDAAIEALIRAPVPLQTIVDGVTDRAGVVLQLLRLDAVDPVLSGNKLYKLLPALSAARRTGSDCLVSFGGRWSNHLHALAALGRRVGLRTVGVVRGWPGMVPTPTLVDAERWGMSLVFADRATWSRRHDADYHTELSRRFGGARVVSEGGSDADGRAGCRQIARTLREAAGDGVDVVAMAVGTGATLAGIVTGLGPATECLGVCALDRADEQRATVLAGIAESAVTTHARWRIDEGYACGGIGRTTPQLLRFMHWFEQTHSVALDPVYTGKLMLALYRMLVRGQLRRGSRVVAIHSGGLQGRRGCDALAAGPAIDSGSFPKVVLGDLAVA